MNKCSEITCNNKASICFGVELGRTQTLKEELEFLKPLEFDNVGCHECSHNLKLVRERIKLISKLEDDEVKE